jgi:HSP20 family protein
MTHLSHLPRLFENRLIHNDDLQPFDIMFRNLFETGSFFEPIYNHLKYPVDIYETDNALKIEIALPNIDKEDIFIDEIDDCLRVSYNKKEETENSNNKYIQRGITRKSFDFAWKISDKFNLKKIEASMDKGLLKIEIPRSEEKKVIKNTIKIK